MHEQPTPLITPPPYHHRKSLAIALVVSAIFLLASAGIFIWLLAKPGGTTFLQQHIGDGSDQVKKVSFVTPTDLPAAYAKREQNTHTAQTAYYSDTASGCSIATSIFPTPQPSGDIKEVVANTAKAAETYGISVVNWDDTNDHKIKDVSGQQTYIFKGLYFEQKVDVQGVPYQSQRKIIAYKKFGPSIASIEYTCRTESWDTKKEQLLYIVNGFKLKTET